MSERPLKLEAWKKQREALGLASPVGPAVHDFKEAAMLMDTEDLRTLKVEIIGVMARIVQTVEDKKEDPDRRRRARGALSFFNEKMRIVGVLLDERTVKSRKEKEATDPESYQNLKAQCIALATEVSRLQNEVSKAPTDARVDVAIEFVEVCRIGMAESAFNRYMDRARDRVRGATRD